MCWPTHKSFRTAVCCGCCRCCESRASKTTINAMLSFINRFKASFLEPPEPTRLSANDNAALLNSTSYFLINANLSFLKKIAHPSMTYFLPRKSAPSSSYILKSTRVWPIRLGKNLRNGPIVPLANTKCPRPFGSTLSKYSVVESTNSVPMAGRTRTSPSYNTRPLKRYRT